MNAEKCKVHATLLKPMNVPISYGLPYFDDELIEARSKLNPNAKTYDIGGCTLNIRSSRYSEEMVCDDCREAQIVWKKANGRENSESLGNLEL